MWKPIRGFEGLYVINPDGQIKNIRTGHIKAKTFDGGGYLTVTLTLPELKVKSKRLRLHRLMAIAFIPNPNNLPVVNHIDRNRTNNTISNLEWCTQKDNINHSISIIGEWRRGRKNLNPVCNPVTAILPDGRLIDYQSRCEAARQLKLSDGRIGVCIRENRLYKGILFKDKHRAPEGV